MKLENSNRTQKLGKGKNKDDTAKNHSSDGYRFNPLQDKLVKMEQSIQEIQGGIQLKHSQYMNLIKTLEDQLNANSQKIQVLKERNDHFNTNEVEIDLDAMKKSLTHPITTMVTDSIKDYIDQKFSLVESNISLINELQLDFNKRLNKIESEFFEYAKAKSEEKEQTTILKEITIEKFYLDKYEQNNNIAQLGIKELSGALNIGATYGTGVIPQELTEQIKSDMRNYNLLIKI